MNKLKEQRLVDLQGVLLKLIETAEDNDEREWLQDFAEEIENKINVSRDKILKLENLKIK